MKKITALIIRLAAKLIGQKRLEKLLIYSAKAINSDLHLHGLINIGVYHGFDHHHNGERLFIENILSDILQTDANPMLFDIGANVGDYTLLLKKSFPRADLYAFEPVKNTFDILTQNVKSDDIKLYNIGFSAKTGTGEIFNTVGNTNTEIASMYKEVFHEVFKNDDQIVSITFKMDTIDNFCLSNQIKKINFLKLDVEGHELSVLKGAANTIANNAIKVIQFEFNVHNVYTRVFLRDFYLILKNFEFYRICNTGLIALGDYHAQNEIFILQNIVAIHKSMSHLIKPRFVKHIS